MVIIIATLITIMLSSIIMIIASTLSKKSIEDREKSSPFECGFDPKSSARLPFSLRFFLISVVFLIFDVEIALLLPSVMTTVASNPKWWLMTSFSFILILLIGLYHEWNQGSLEWAL
uniref:NADH dehydrogenase subunit 3 n=1 Tax=Eucorydia linglong TaxID=3037041 RepID=UPI0027A2FA91|nr:NADH dehydrogenase subunit 3 [Eucorydia linglong]WGO57814.1 NADH dehydrogenase subunit 3 [Eucorydia linglong]